MTPADIRAQAEEEAEALHDHRLMPPSLIFRTTGIIERALLDVLEQTRIDHTITCVERINAAVVEAREKAEEPLVRRIEELEEIGRQYTAMTDPLVSCSAWAHGGENDHQCGTCRSCWIEKAEQAKRRIEELEKDWQAAVRIAYEKTPDCQTMAEAARALVTFIERVQARADEAERRIASVPTESEPAIKNPSATRGEGMPTPDSGPGQPPSNDHTTQHLWNQKLSSTFCDICRIRWADLKNIYDPCPGPAPHEPQESEPAKVGICGQCGSVLVGHCVDGSAHEPPPESAKEGK